MFSPLQLDKIVKYLNPKIPMKYVLNKFKTKIVVFVLVKRAR